MARTKAQPKSIALTLSPADQALLMRYRRALDKNWGEEIQASDEALLISSASVGMRQYIRVASALAAEDRDRKERQARYVATAPGSFRRFRFNATPKAAR